MNRTQAGVTYGTNMPPELMQNHPYGRVPYGQQTMGMYTQNQPLPPGELPACSLIIFTFFSNSTTRWFSIHQEPFWDCGLRDLFFHRRSRFRTSIQTYPQPTDEQNDAHSTQLPRHDARHAGKHAWHDGTGQAIPNGL